MFETMFESEKNRSIVTRRRPSASLVAAAAVVVLWADSPPAEAQVPDLVELSGQYAPGVPVEQSPPAEAQVASYDAAVNVPLSLSSSTYLIVGGAYHVDSVSFSMTLPDFVDLRSFHSTELSLLLVQLLPNDWSLSFRLAPGLAGDFQAVDVEMLRLNAMVMATYKFSDSFILGGGLLTTYSFGSLLPLPAAYLEYRPVPNVRIEAFLPAFAWARWHFWNRLEIGVRAEFQGNEYAVRDRRIRDAYPCRAQPNDDPSTDVDERVRNADACLDHFAYSVGTGGVTVGLRVWESVWLSFFGGHTFFRRFEPKNAGNDTLPDGGNSLDNTFIVRANLVWRIPEE